MKSSAKAHFLLDQFLTFLKTGNIFDYVKSLRNFAYNFTHNQN